CGRHDRFLLLSHRQKVASGDAGDDLGIHGGSLRSGAEAHGSYHESGGENDEGRRTPSEANPEAATRTKAPGPAGLMRFKVLRKVRCQRDGGSGLPLLDRGLERQKPRSSM